MAVTFNLPSEGLFILDRQAAIPLLYLRKGGKISNVDLDMNEINRFGIDEVLRRKGFTNKQIKAIPDFNPADVSQQLGREESNQRIPIETALKTQPAKAEEKTVESPALGSLARSIGSAPGGQFQAPQPSRIAGAEVGPEAAQFAGTATGKKATLTSSDGKFKTVVDVGSSEASRLQSAGWVLGATGKQTLQLNQAIEKILPTPQPIPPSPVPSPTQPAAAQRQATLSSPDGSFKTVVNVGSPEASRLQSSGWTLGATGKQALQLDQALEKISVGAQPTPAPVPTQPPPIVQQQATLTSPDGLRKTVVTVGGPEASKLQNAGWTLGDTGKTTVNVQDAINFLTAPTPTPQAGIDPATGKPFGEAAPPLPGTLATSVSSRAEPSPFQAPTPLPSAPAESVDRGGFGAQQSPEPTPPSGPSPESLLKYGDSVRASGIGEDVWNAMTPDQKSFFSAMSAMQQKNIENQKALIPKSLSAEDMKRFFEDATKEFENEPYYQNIIEAGKKDFLFNLSQMTGEYDAADDLRKRQLEQGLDVTAEEAAEAGRARSTVRTVAEQRLREGSTLAAESLRRRARGDVEKLGTGFERQFGTAALQGIGIPKVLGQQFTPQGAVGGEFERKKKESIAQYRQFLANEELLKRGVIGPFQFQQPSFITTDVTTKLPFAQSVTSQ